MNRRPDPLFFLIELERAVYARRIEDATAAMLKLLALLLLWNERDGLLPDSAPAADRQAVYTRIAAACMTLIADPAFELTGERYAEFCSYKVVLANVLAASGFADTTHWGSVFGTRGYDGRTRYDAAALRKWCLMASLDDMPASVFTEVINLPGAQLLPLLLGWLRQRAVLSAQGEANRTRLLESGSRIENEVLTDDLLSVFVSAWMYCSYSSAAHKHQIKGALNRLMQGWIQRKGIQAHCTPREVRDHPTLAIIGESLRAGHAMFRCYAEKFAQMRGKFRLVLIAPKGDQDDVSRAYFDEWVEVSNLPDDLAETVARIEAVSPDMLYYPSVGMGFLTIALANLRLAPIQIMSIGHPATSLSPFMDYVVVGPGLRAASGAFNERVLIRDGYGYFAPHPELPDTLPVPVARPDEPLHIAVNGIAMKLSAQLLDICSRLEAASSRALVFHFFPAERGVRLDGIRALIGRRFPTARVYPRLAYPEYLRLLAECGIVLSPFPFGNTNCTVDASLLGIPMVAYAGTEPHSLTDRRIMGMLDLPGWLVGEDEESYYRAAERLVTDAAARSAIASQLLGMDVRKRLFSLPAGEEEATFFEAVWHVYRCHEQIVASGLKVIDMHEGRDSKPPSGA